MTPEQPITSERKHKQELKTLAVKTPPGSDWMQMIFNWLIIKDSYFSPTAFGHKPLKDDVCRVAMEVSDYI